MRNKKTFSLSCWAYVRVTILPNMFLPIRLLQLELRRRDCLKEFLKYQDLLVKLTNNKLRIEFLDNCKRADIIPHFLKFRIPNNGCFDEQSIHDFQKKLLHKEFIKAKEDQINLSLQLSMKRSVLVGVLPYKCIPSVVLHCRLKQRQTYDEGKHTHNQKLYNLSEEQEKPLFNVSNTVRLFELDKTPPTYVIETLSLGPRNPVIERFNPNDVLVELDRFIYPN